jgi:beta-carotene 3-hydroxylase
MTSVLRDILISISAFCCMEGVAWFTHKYIMHGILWSLHKDHHKKESAGFFEHNDFFFLIFAIPGILSLLLGIRQDYSFFFWIGLGITLYGFVYFFVHDIFIHRRFRWLRKSRNPYFRGVRRAHKMHHKHLEKGNGECFGMLLVPFKYFRKETQEKKP